MLMSKSILFRSFFLVLFLIALFKPILDKGDHTAKEEAELEVTEENLEEELPLHDVQLPLFAKIADVKEKKRQFFGFLKNAVVEENNRISKLRAKVLEVEKKLINNETLTAEEGVLINSLSKLYKIKKLSKSINKIEQLKKRINIVPVSLVLVQAANESAWGTSRFARIGLNFFGLWCYKKGCGMVPGGRDQGLKHEVAAFSSVSNAVRSYLHNINTHYAYEVFRTIRSQLQHQNKPLSAELLVTGLLPYSERGIDYILELTEMIRHNKMYL